MNKSDILIESKTMRDSVADRTDILDKVKKLELLPDDINLNVEMAANYYEVGIEAIHSNFKDNRIEFESDGLKILKGEELKKFVMSHKDMARYVSKKTRSLSIFPKRALLRLGMLLKESKVAQSVRDYLLDSESEKTKSPAPMSIEDLIIMQATSVKELKTEVAQLKEQRNEDSKKIDQVTEAVSTMADQLTSVPGSQVVVKTVNELHRWTRMTHNEIYNKGYEMLKMKHGIDVRRRMENEREKIQKEYHEKTGKWYADSTLRQKVNGMDIMVRMECLDKFNEIIAAWLAKEKTKSTLRLVR